MPAPAAVVQVRGNIRAAGIGLAIDRAFYLARDLAGDAAFRFAVPALRARVAAGTAVEAVGPGIDTAVAAVSQPGVKAAQRRTVALDAGGSFRADVPNPPAVGGIGIGVGITAEAADTGFPLQAPVPAGAAVVGIR
jgi:hypothetical protein